MSIAVTPALKQSSAPLVIFEVLWPAIDKIAPLDTIKHIFPKLSFVPVPSQSSCMTSAPAFQSLQSKFTAHPAPEPRASETRKAPILDAVAVCAENETETPVKLLDEDAETISKIPAETVVYIVVVWFVKAKMF